MEKIIFFGAGPYSQQIIESLNNAFDLLLVVTTEKNSDQPVPSVCTNNSIPFISVSSIDDETISKIQKLNASVGILASFGVIVPDELLKSFEHGIINIHPSLLPKYRGATPVQSAILNGDKTTGVSIMKLDTELDHGPVLAQSYEQIDSKDTSDDLYKKLFSSGTNILLAALPKYIRGELKLMEQEHNAASYTERLSRENGLIRLDNPPEKDQLNRMIRAYHPWPGVWFKANINGKEKSIKLLPEGNIQVEGKNIMSYKDFSNGYPEGNIILKALNLL